jgi:hypothetical protein
MQFFIGSDPTDASDSFWVNWQTGTLEMDFPSGLDHELNNAPILTFAERARRQQRVTHGHDSSGLPSEPLPATVLGAGQDDLLVTKAMKKKKKKRKDIVTTQSETSAQRLVAESQLVAEASASAETARRERQAAMSAATNAALGWAKRQCDSKLPEVAEGDEDAADDHGDMDNDDALPDVRSSSKQQDADRIGSQNTVSTLQQPEIPPDTKDEQEQEHGEGEGGHGQECGQENGDDPQQGLEENAQNLEREQQQKVTRQVTMHEDFQDVQVTSRRVVAAPSPPVKESLANERIRKEAECAIASGSATNNSGEAFSSNTNKQSEAKTQPGAGKGEGGLTTVEDNGNATEMNESAVTRAAPVPTPPSTPPPKRNAPGAGAAPCRDRPHQSSQMQPRSGGPVGDAMRKERSLFRTAES